MTALTPERLASIRLRLGNARFHLGESDRLVEERSEAYRIPLSGTVLDDTADLLAHVDHLTAERDGWKARHAALRRTVETMRSEIIDRYGVIDDILDRDSERGEQA